jgi:hypothetical protein
MKTKEEKTNYAKQWRLDHKEESSKRNKQYRLDNKERLKLQKEQYNLAHKEEVRLRRKESYFNNKERYATYNQQNYLNHKEKRAIYSKQYIAKRIKSDLNFRLRNRIRARIQNALKSNNTYKSSYTIELLGCSIKEVRKYIESKFTKGMTWDNWSNDGWHLDHIIPVAFFDLTDIEQQKRCFHYTNLQPLWAEENRKKHDKIIEIQLTLL